MEKSAEITKRLKRMIPESWAEKPPLQANMARPW